jgi:gluconolactonase
MEVEKLGEGYVLVEGPRVDAKNNLYFTDIDSGVFRRSPDGKIVMIKERKWVGGLALNADGRIVASGERGLIIFDPESGKEETLLDHLEGFPDPKPAFNDIQPDGEGGLYAGGIDPAGRTLGKTEPRPIVHIAPNRKARIVSDGTKIANGIGLSKDGKKLYQVETMDGVLAFDRAPDGSLSNKRLIVEHPIADGMAVDQQDGIWIAAAQDGSVKRYTPDGKFDRRIEVPVQFVTSLTFGGSDLKDLYIVTASPIHKPTWERCGALYRVRSDIAGLPTPPTRF